MRKTAYFLILFFGLFMLRADCNNDEVNDEYPEGGYQQLPSEPSEGDGLPPG